VNVQHEGDSHVEITVQRNVSKGLSPLVNEERKVFNEEGISASEPRVGKFKESD